MAAAPFLAGLLLAGCSVALTTTAAGTQSTTQPTTPPKLAFTVTGPEQTVFHHATQACQTLDYPDDAARAFTDASGTVHLISSSNVNTTFTGPNLNNVTHNCTMAYFAGQSADPSAFDDWGWLESFYTTDGNTVNALVSMDYHPYRHQLPCATGPTDTTDTYNCWYSTITQATSTDGGNTFVAPAQGVARFVSGAPYVFSSTHVATVGSLVPSNIVALNGYYYSMVYVASDQLQAGGECVMRTQNLSDPTAWRAWDGTGYNVQFLDPYTTPSLNPAQSVCTTVGAGVLQPPVRSLQALSNGTGYVAVMFGTRTVNGASISSVVASTSLDLIHWTAEVPVLDLPNFGNETCAANAGQYAYYYPSMLDANSTTRNFETVGSTAYIYATKFILCNENDRDLVRYPVSIALSY
jgi:hypothetical protein